MDIHVFSFNTDRLAGTGPSCVSRCFSNTVRVRGGVSLLAIDSRRSSQGSMDIDRVSRPQSMCGCWIKQGRTMHESSTACASYNIRVDLSSVVSCQVYAIPASGISRAVPEKGRHLQPCPGEHPRCLVRVTTPSRIWCQSMYIRTPSEDSPVRPRWTRRDKDRSRNRVIMEAAWATLDDFHRMAQLLTQVLDGKSMNVISQSGRLCYAYKVGGAYVGTVGHANLAPASVRRRVRTKEERGEGGGIPTEHVEDL